MRYIELAKACLYSYKSNCAELFKLEHDNRPTAPMINGYIKGRISKPVEAEVMRLLKDERYKYLTQSTQAVEYAIAKVQQFPEGEITVKIFETVYRDKTHTLYGSSELLHISYLTAKRYNAYMVKMTAIRMGYIPVK